MDDPEPSQALELIDSGLFSHGDRKLSLQLTQSLRLHDPYLVCADFRAYPDCQEDVGRCWRDTEHWTHMSILDVRVWASSLPTVQSANMPRKSGVFNPWPSQFEHFGRTGIQQQSQAWHPRLPHFSSQGAGVTPAARVPAQAWRGAA